MGVEGIILAAGLSSRAGAFKMALELRGKTIIQNTLETMLEFCERVIVVGGFGIEKLEPIIMKYPKAVLVLNECYESGMFSSVLKGMSFLRRESFFLTPGDCPLIGSEVYRELLKYEGDIIIPVYEGRRGHPVLFKSRMTLDMLKSERYESLRDFIRERSPVLVPVNCSGILRDVDTREDYEEIVRETLTRG